jgi:pimeloyl-ACP methyl ester carboxylesterase
MMHAALRNEMAFFSFNNRGHGSITIFTKLRHHLLFRSIGTTLENFKECLLDIDGALKMLRERGYENFILSGHSTGCQKITYYQYKRKARSVKGLVLLAPSDDLNSQIKLIGPKKFKESLKEARRMIRAGKGKEILHVEHDPPYFSAKRYYELYKPGSVEGRLFNYSGRLNEISSIRTPVLAFFGTKEDFAVIPPRKMLKILQGKLRNKFSKTILVDGADHCFCNHEEDVEYSISKWLRNLLW